MNTERYFYSVLKNEDATPYIGNNLLIVADGLGGAGSTVHNITPVEGATLHDEILEAAFFDFDFQKAQDMAEYLEHLVSPMADDKPDTSALWASRIAIARCAYALEYESEFANCDLSNGSVRKRLAKFISSGLNCIAGKFLFGEVKYDNQKVLPTTLAFVRYATDGNGTTTAEVVWAGDSRCYLLTKDGLKQLSVDNEDKSGAITNLFFAGRGKATNLNYEKYEINEPCVLMAVSDGIFDPFEPYDNLGVEKTLLEHINKNDSYENLMSSLSTFYDGVRSDDATMAFVPVGFERYKDLRETLTSRTECIARVWQNLHEMNAVLEVANLSEVDVRSYIENRTRDKFQAIITTLLEKYKDFCNDSVNIDSDDAAYTDEIKQIIKTAKTQLVAERKTAAERRIKNAIEQLREWLKNNLPTSIWDIFVCPTENKDSCDKASLVSNIENGYRELVDALKEKERVTTCGAIVEEYRSVIKERLTSYIEWFLEPNYCTSETVQMRRNGQYLESWLKIMYDVRSCNQFCGNYIDNLDSKDKNQAREIINFVYNNRSRLMTSPAEITAKIKCANDKYRVAVEQLFTCLLKDPQICKKVFTKSIIKRYNLSETQEEQANIRDDDIISALIPQRDELSTAIVNALAEHYDKGSILDAYYIATKLNAFRAYYKTKANQNTRSEVAALKKQLQALEREYLSMLKAVEE